MKVTSLTATGKTSTTTVPDALFAAPVNKQVLAQAIRVYLSNKRQGTARVQTRADVSRTKKKWFRQKGTGNARHGSRSAPLFVGGGVAHGPNGLQNWTKKLSQQLRGVALRSALSAQVDRVVIVDAVDTLKGKTKEAAVLVQAAAPKAKKILVILADAKPEVVRSLRNLPQVFVTRASRVTALEVAMAQTVILPSSAVTALEQRLNPTESAAPKVTKKSTKKEAKA